MPSKQYVITITTEGFGIIFTKYTERDSYNLTRLLDACEYEYIVEITDIA